MTTLTSLDYFSENMLPRYSIILYAQVLLNIQDVQP